MNVQGEVKNSAPREPRLQPPGAGLPYLEYFISRYFYLPRYFKKTSWAQAQSRFDRESEKILSLAKGLEPSEIQQKVLIKRIGGMEDSSRYWSVSMTMEHLIIVGSALKEAIVGMSKGQSFSKNVSTADVKPLGEKKNGGVIISEFETFVKEFSQAMSEASGAPANAATCKHPWFGRLNRHQTHCIASIHQGIHRRQVEAILAGLKR